MTTVNCGATSIAKHTENVLVPSNFANSCETLQRLGSVGYFPTDKK